MDQLYLRCEDRLAAWGESLRSCCDAFERTCCGALIARKKTRAALICGLDGVGKTTVLCCVPAVRRNLEKWARKHGVDELHTAPTCGHQLVEFAMTRSATARCERRARVNWRVWDVSGKENWRGAWLMFCAHSHAVVFVVDATDVDRLGLARKELHQLFRHPALKKMPLLVLCNKSDGQTQPTENPVHADAEAPAPAPAPADSSSESDDEGKKDETKEAPKTDEPPQTPRSSQILTADQVKAALQLDALQAQNRLDVRVIETTVTTGKGIDAGFQWLTDKVDYM